LLTAATSAFVHGITVAAWVSAVLLLASAALAHHLLRTRPGHPAETTGTAQPAAETGSTARPAAETGSTRTTRPAAEAETASTPAHR
jgi:DHA2 family multidrug resistance protein-like MFS transporter